MADHPLLHVLDYGDSGAGKSTFADSFPNPKLVFSFDAYGKELPYLKGGEVSPIQTDDRGTPFREVTSRKSGKVLKRVEYYHDSNWTEPEQIRRKAGTSIRAIKPNAYERFLKRMARIADEYSDWATTVVDSVTTMEICARRWDQYTLNPGAEDARQWYGASKDMLEQMLLNRFANLPMNVIVLAHIDDEKYEYHGIARRMPMAPGKLRGSLGTQFGEVYHQYVDKDGERWLMTQPDGVWSCMSQIGAPNPCMPHYQMLWEHYDQQEKEVIP